MPTLPVDADVFAMLQQESERTGESVDLLVNRALRRALLPSHPFRVDARDLELRPGYSLERTSSLLSQLDREEAE